MSSLDSVKLCRQHRQALWVDREGCDVVTMPLAWDTAYVYLATGSAAYQEVQYIGC